MANSSLVPKDVKMKKGTVPQLSVIIVTRNRIDSLQKVIHSLLIHESLPDEIIIIDNNSTDKTAQSIKHIQKSALTPIHYFLEKQVGYPNVYNRGLQQAKYNWVAFIDDDCIAEKTWVAEFKKAIMENPKSAAILGESKTTYVTNTFSLMTVITDQYWKQNKINGQQVLNFEILDNKNIVYNKQFLTKNNIQFDETRTSTLNGAAEDCDLGLQIEKARGTAIYHSKAIVYHHDPTHLIWYYKRYIKSFAAYLFFRQKWPEQRALAQSAQKIKLKEVMWRTFTEYRTTLIKRILVFCLISLTVGTSLLLSKLTQSSRFQNRFIQYAEKL